MERTSKEEVNIPSIKEIRLERRRLARQNRKRRIFLNTIYTLIIVAAVAVLLATLFFGTTSIWYKHGANTGGQADYFTCKDQSFKNRRSL